MIISFVIIDDDLLFRATLARSLCKLGCTVTHFATPNNAIEAITGYTAPSENPLIILLDLKLEADSGLLWIEQLKDANRNSQIILLTGYASIATAIEAIKLGAHDYLPKPITAREILAHLSQTSTESSVTVNEKPMSVQRLEWEHIQKVLNGNAGNISATARALGMHRRTLQRKLLKKPVRT